ncbi:MAG TPA: hypothetical protein VF834_23815 [Streptosporangiaceae bacterium]
MSLSPHARRIATAATGALAASLAVALPATASTTTPSVSYTFKRLDNSNDLSFNQLLGINNYGLIAGYFGSGLQGHKNKGYLLKSPYRQTDYVVENFPTSAQTQVTGLNSLTGSSLVTVGFFSHTNKANPGANANFGFYKLAGHYHEVVFPAGQAPSGKFTPNVDQLLGVNNSGEAVGFYLDSHGNSRGYLFNVHTHKFVSAFPGATLRSAVSLTASGINNNGDVTGFFSLSTGPIRSFLVTRTGQVKILAFPGADATQAFGLNDHREVVGAYAIGGKSFGFTWTPGGGFKTVSDPAGIGTTFINGVNNAGDLVGFYTDAKNNTHGMLAIP